jgi:hypothetical protein
MTDDGHAPTEPWYRASPKNLAIFALIWSGEAFLILKFVTWVTHGSAALYLLMIPWTLFGSIIAVRPNWITRMTRAFEGELGTLPGKTEVLPSSKSTYPSCGYTGTYRRTAVSWLITELNGCGGLEGP